MRLSRRLLRMLSLVAVFALILSACAAPTAAPGGEASAPAEEAEAPAEESAAEAGPFEPMSYSAPDCEYGGSFNFTFA